MEVPPETTMLSRAETHARRKSAISWVRVDSRVRSASLNTVLENLRMLMLGPFSESGGMMILTREPSGRRASTIGLLSSTRRPKGATIRSTMRMSCFESRKQRSISLRMPLRSM